MPILPKIEWQRPALSLQLQEGPIDNNRSVAASLPPELWGCIAKFLDLEDLSRLYLLNRAFYDALISREFHHVILLLPASPLRIFKQELALLNAMQNPLIKGKVRRVHFDGAWETNLISALNSRGWKSCFPRPLRSRFALLMGGRLKRVNLQALQEKFQGAVSRLSNVTHLSLVLRHPLPNFQTLDTLWTACSQTLVDLSLRLHSSPQDLDHLGRLRNSCPQLRKLDVTVVANSRLPAELLNEVRGLIPKDGGCMEDFSIGLYGDQPLLFNSSFGSLTKLRLYGDHPTMSSILPFVAPHRDTLREIALGTTPSKDLRNINLLNTSILTSLSIHGDPLLEHHEMFPFLSHCTCLRTMILTQDRHFKEQSSEERTPLFFHLLHFLPPSLTDLTFPGLVLDFQFLLSITQCLPKISCLTLTDCYPANKEIEGLFYNQGAWDPTMGIWTSACAVHFTDLQTRLGVLTPEDWCKSKEAAIWKLFFTPTTRPKACCNIFFGGIYSTL